MESKDIKECIDAGIDFWDGLEDWRKDETDGQSEAYDIGMCLFHDRPKLAMTAAEYVYEGMTIAQQREGW